MAWFHRLLNSLRSEKTSRDIDRELAFHIDERVDELRGRGMPEPQARLLARRQFGNQTLQRERTREADVAGLVESVTGDARYALRALRHSPVFAIVAVVSLGLGIGANTTIFTLLDTLVLRPLPVARPHELVRVGVGENTGPGDYFTNPLWEQVRDRQDVFVAMAAFGYTSFNLAESGEARRVNGSYVNGDYFNTFGAQPAVGRLFTRSDDVRGCPGIAVLSYRFWQREYGGAAGVVGHTIRLTGHPFQVVGVADAGFRGPDVGREADVFAPLCSEAIVRGTASALDRRSNWWLRVIGRRQPGVDVRQVQVHLTGIARASHEQTVPPQWAPQDQAQYVTRTFFASPAEHGFSDMREQYGKALYALMAGVALILLIACANVANLLLSRAEARHREVAIRLAIGAGRGRLLRQMLTESLVLAVVGAALGLLIAHAGARAMVALITTQDSINGVSLDLALNGRLLGFTIAVATLTVLLCGLVPALRATRVNAQSAMKAQSRGLVEGHSRWSLGKALVVAQIALSLVLVVAAGLFLGTFRNLSRVDPGFTTAGILVVDVDLRRAGVAADAIAATYRSIRDRVRAIPGVESVSSADLAPMGGATWNDEVVVDGFTPKSMMDAVTWFNEVADGFFTTMETRLLAGRDFDRSDVPGSPKVAIVNDAWGRHFFGNESPIGRTFRLRPGGKLGDPYTIVGVVENATYRTLRHGHEATAYVASSQNAAPGPIRSLVLRTQGHPALVIPAVKEAMRDVGSGVTLDFRTLSRMLADGLQRERMLAILAGLFGSLALALAILGLYGVMSYAVARRRGELGVRIALGAVRARVVRMVLREVSVVVVFGMMIGTATALATTKLVTTFLYGVRPNEPGVYVAAIALLGAVAIGAGFIPAWRAARVDPIEALRQD